MSFQNLTPEQRSENARKGAATRKAKADQNFSHVALGPSNEELEARDQAIIADRKAKGLPKVEMGRDREDKRLFEDEFTSGSNALVEAVREYVPPGFAPKFLSDNCLNVLGRRGYEMVKDDNGDVVRVGTLKLGIIPQERADRRRERFQQESQERTQSLEEDYSERLARLQRDAAGLGVSVLQRDEVMPAQVVSEDRRGFIRETDDNRTASLEITHG